MFNSSKAYSSTGSISEEDLLRMFDNLRRQQQHTYTGFGRESTEGTTRQNSTYNGFGTFSDGTTWQRSTKTGSTTASTLPVDVRQAYSVLGIADNATQADIKAARNRLVKQHHPDLNTDKEQATKKTIEINKAYEKAISWAK